MAIFQGSVSIRRRGVSVDNRRPSGENAMVRCSLLQAGGYRGISGNIRDIYIKFKATKTWISPPVMDLMSLCKIVID